MKKLLCSTFLFCVAAFSLSASPVYTDNIWRVNQIKYASNNDIVIPEATAFRARMTDKALIIEFKLEGHHWKSFQKTPFKIECGVWPRGESVEVFLDPGRSCSRYIQLAAGLNGKIYDNRYTKKTGKKWAAKWTVQRKDFKGGSYLTFTVPFDDEFKKPQLGEIWGFNVCRNVHHSARYFSTYAKVGSIFNTPSKFAELRFGTMAEFKKFNQAKNRKKFAQAEKEIRTLGLTKKLSAQIQYLKKDCNDTHLQDLIDEMNILKRMKEAK